MTRRIATFLVIAVFVLGSTLACGCATSGLGKGPAKGTVQDYTPNTDIYVRFSTVEEDLTGRTINGITFFGYPMVVILNPRLYNDPVGDRQKYELYRTTVHEFWHVMGWNTHGDDKRGFSYYQALLFPRIFEPNGAETWGAKHPPLGWNRTVWVWDEELIPVVAEAIEVWNKAAGGRLFILMNRAENSVPDLQSCDLEILTLD